MNATLINQNNRRYFREFIIKQRLELAVILVLLITAVIFCVSCSQTPRTKVATLVQERAKKSVALPSSYTKIEISIDSAYAPNNDPNYYEKMLQAGKYDKQILKCKNSIKQLESSMEFWSKFHSTYEKIRYNEDSVLRDTYIQKITELNSYVDKVYDELAKLTKQPRRFIGYKVIHRYRAKKDSGEDFVVGYLYIIDKDCKKILAEYDLDSEDYKTMKLAILNFKNVLVKKSFNSQ